MAYATAAELKFELQGDNTTYDTYDALFTTLVNEASEAIDNHCHRNFVVPSVATVRYFFPTVLGDELANLSDIASTTGLVVAYDEAGDGTFSTTLGASDYSLYVDPLNGMVTNIVAANLYGFKRSRENRPLYKVTARYGWPAVPGPVHRACIITARRYFLRKDTPTGILGFGDMGAVKLSSVDPDVQALLAPYRNVGGLIA